VILTGPLDATAADAVRALLTAAAEADGVMPASEDARLGLSDPGRTHVRAVLDDGSLAGYAQVGREGTAELVVHPNQRRKGVGRMLLHRILSLGADRIWAHGDHPGAAFLASAAGLTRTRSLWQLRRPLQDLQLPAPVLPAGVTVRSFEPGDESAWLAVNAAAFADHPEQGRWTISDLSQRMTEPWFDPAGLLVAVRGERMVGFHWMKVEQPDEGEVYVLGVDPAEQGTGLGRALLLIGLRQLRDRGLSQVTLYVEESNVGARRLYSSIGFTRSAIDVQYSASSGPTRRSSGESTE
jgi:mycothiol synthase